MNKFLKPFGILSITAFSSLAIAGDFPERTITIVNPYAPGGNADIQSRHIADFLSKKFDVTVNVESRAGGGALLG